MDEKEKKFGPVERGFTMHAEGSVLVSFGATRVLCTASVEERVPPWKKAAGGRKRALEDLTPFQDDGAGFVEKVKGELEVWA